MQGNGAGCNEAIFSIEAAPLKYDPEAMEAGTAPRIRELVEPEATEVEGWDEPTANLLREVAGFAVEGEFGGFVADSGREIRRTVDALGVIHASGHDHEEWPESKKVPGYYS